MRLPWRHCAFDPVKDKSNHLLLRVEVFISHRKLLCRNRFLAIRVVRYRCWGEEGMNAVDGSSSNGWNVLAILRLGGGITKHPHAPGGRRVVSGAPSCPARASGSESHGHNARRGAWGEGPTFIISNPNVTCEGICHAFVAGPRGAVHDILFPLYDDDNDRGCTYCERGVNA